MQIAPRPKNEKERLKELYSFNILDSKAEPKYDRIVQLAATICKVPIALISLVDDDRQWFKSKIGIEACETSRDESFCSHAILQAGLFEVPDAKVDNRFSDNPLVVDGLKIRFYAGEPLVTARGARIGTLCVIDREKRKLDETQKKVLKELAMTVVTLLEESKRKDLVLQDLVDFKTSIESFMIVARTDVKGKITYANKRFIDISGYSKKELIGQNHRILSSGVHEKDFFKRMWFVIANGKPWEGVICNKTKNGSLYWVQTFIFPRFKNGKLKEYISYRFDITEQVKLRDELREEKDKAALSSQLAAVGELSAGIAHEIANPLTMIQNSSNLLEKKIPVELSKYTQYIDKSVVRISKIIKGLHHLAQKSRSDDVVDTGLETIISNTLEFCSEVLKGKGIELLIDNPFDHLTIPCNDVKVSQIILNLINNARDAILESESDEKWIRVEIRSDHDFAIIRVIDSGPGIAEEHKKKIFESFFTTKQVGKGTGLGLALVSRFIKEHEGEFLLNEDYKNTCFEVRLPLKRKMSA